MNNIDLANSIISETNMIGSMTFSQLASVPSPQQGDMVYDTTNNEIKFWDGTCWTGISSSADDTTAIILEKSNELGFRGYQVIVSRGDDKSIVFISKREPNYDLAKEYGVGKPFSITIEDLMMNTIDDILKMVEEHV